MIEGPGRALIAGRGFYYIDMAHSWHALARQHAKNSQSETPVYDTQLPVDKKA